MGNVWIYYAFAKPVLNHIDVLPFSLQQIHRVELDWEVVAVQIDLSLQNLKSKYYFTRRILRAGSEEEKVM